MISPNAKEWWHQQATIPRARRNLMFFDGNTKLGDDWIGTSIAIQALDHTNVNEVKAWENTVVVIDGLSKAHLNDPTSSRAIFEIVCTALKNDAPILVRLCAEMKELKLYSVGKTEDEPWDVDLSALLRSEELMYLLQSVCAVPPDQPDTYYSGAIYLTPIERSLAIGMQNEGIHFLPQHRIGNFHVDFLVDGRLIVECDGAGYHDKAKDRERDSLNELAGYPSIRFTGREIFASPEACVTKIQTYLRSDALGSVAPAPSNELTQEQKNVVAHLSGPALVVASPGSGKTHVVVERIRYLVSVGVDPSRIAAISYTNAAVDEMISRLEGAPVLCTTIHKLANKLVVQEESKRTILTDSPRDVKEKLRYLRQSAAAVGGNFEKEIQESFGYPRLLEIVEEFRSSFDIPQDIDSEMGKNFRALHQGYESRMGASKVTDFDGMVINAIRILLGNPKIRLTHSSKFDYWIVDEFQDLPKSKMLLLRLLASPARNLMAVGDDDQLIFGFAGASPNHFNTMNEDWSDLREYGLTKNFRNPPDLVKRASWLVERNRNRKLKHVVSGRAGASPSVEVSVRQDYEVVGLDFVEKCLKLGHKPNEIALLFRQRMSAAPVERMLEGRGIAFTPLSIGSIANNRISKLLQAWLRVAVDLANRNDWNTTLRMPKRYLTSETISWLVGGSGAVQSSIPMEQLLDRFYGVLPSKIPGMSQKQSDASSPIVHDAINQFIVLVSHVQRLAPTCSPLQIIDTLNLRTALQEFDSSKESKVDNPPALDSFEVIRRLIASESSIEQAIAVLAEDDTKFGDSIEKADLPENDSDRIKLLTIHSAKGKEWKCVAVLGPPESMPDYRNTVGLLAEEERRIAYVAVTRARELLMFSSSNQYVGELSNSIRGESWGD